MSNQSLKFLVDPKDIAALAVFLASDAAKSISGQIMPIDGDMQRNRTWRCAFRRDPQNVLPKRG